MRGDSSGRSARPRPGRRGRSRGRARRSRRDRRAVGGRARTSLRRFRQATIVAVALTGILLLLFAPAGDTTTGVLAQEASVPAEAQAELPDTLVELREVPTEEIRREAAEDPGPPDEAVRVAAEEATETLRDLWISFLANLPKVGIALGVLLLAWLITAILKPLLRRVLRGWDRARAAAMLTAVCVWLLAIGIAITVLAGDIRALIGSIGLIGLALSWALQTPIESFTGWLLNSFRGYYRVGDRIAVGEIFGDVYRIDMLTTTVWEYGGSERPEGAVMAEQPTGRLITFPNNEVLAGSIVNYTRDFPYVWDELPVPVGNKSDLAYGREILLRVAGSVIGEAMREPAERYEEILRRSRLESSVSREPQVFVSLADSWTELTIRYLVPARERRKWKSDLAEMVMSELRKEEHDGRIIPVTPRRQVQFIGPDGMPREPGGGPSD